MLVGLAQVHLDKVYADEVFQRCCFVEHLFHHHDGGRRELDKADNNVVIQGRLLVAVCLGQSGTIVAAMRTNLSNSS